MKNWNKEIVKEVCPQITIKITKEDVVDILSSALNGGIGYWGAIDYDVNIYNKTHDWLKENVESDYDDGEICYEEILAQMLFDGKEIIIKDKEADTGEGIYHLSLKELAAGVAATHSLGYYYDYNWLVPDGRSGNWRLETSQIDAEVADAIIQCALFWDVIYG